MVIGKQIVSGKIPRGLSEITKEESIIPRKKLLRVLRYQNGKMTRNKKRRGKLIFLASLIFGNPPRKLRKEIERPTSKQEHDAEHDVDKGKKLTNDSANNWNTIDRRNQGSLRGIGTAVSLFFSIVCGKFSVPMKDEQ